MQKETVDKKDRIRKEVLKRRNDLSSDKISEKSRLIFEKLLGLPEYIEASSILIYASMKSEVLTDDIIVSALDSGKKIYCPKCVDTDNGRMVFIRIHGTSDLKSGYKGIREPEYRDESEVFKASDENALVIVPGVAFDRSGNRIGYKGGYYDRFLSGNSELKTLALAFEEQLVKEIPVEDHDIPVQKVLYA